MRLRLKPIRFSIRWLLLLTTVTAIALYALFIRPTIVAERFVDSIARRNYEAARSQIGDSSLRILNHGVDYFKSATLLHAEILPRDWGDVWRCRRRILFRVGQREVDAIRYLEWTSDIDLVARPTGILVVDSTKLVSLPSVDARKLEYPPRTLNRLDYTLLP